MQLDSGTTVSADKATTSAISQRRKQPRDLAEQSLGEKLKELRTLILEFCDFQNNTGACIDNTKFQTRIQCGQFFVKWYM